MSDLLDEAHEFLLCMDKMEYADALFALRAELTEARRQLAAQPAVPEAVAKDAARYRACRYAALAADNDPLIEQMLDWPNVSTADEFDIQTDQIAAILSATDSEVKK